jgi:mono/diheme cytochrome c family protein
MRLVSLVGASAIAALGVLTLCIPGAGLAQAASAENGKIAFTRNGCWQCHGFNGQGSVATSNGRVIARTALPLDAFKSFVRTTNGPMPPFRPAVLSDSDLDDIYAYLQSQPQPKAVSDIQLLNGVRSQ